ncbi:hypothetical protein GKZ89_16435 [Bacillus mangrovi]|uniref:Uncharacterized protein n=1 Tax=Metabacillus mangrovi TaxID=1491830 RepID=A0A7X2S7C5_9BACI|nr:hypothetical protein [Metabacillus mangrovi]MTH54992.1 hypothetical protein [Metabacillus mangrovi]
MQKKLLLFTTLLVTFKLYAVSIFTLEIHNPPRSLALQTQQGPDQPRHLLAYR